MPTPSAMYASVLQNDFAAFVHRSFLEYHGSRYLHNWHVDVLASKLEEVRLGRCKRLIINVPPRHLKSHMASVAFPAWVLGHDPSKRIITASYAQDLSEKLARDGRNLMTSPFYQAVFDTRLSIERQAVSDFHTTEGGYRFSSSVTGGVTGFGADIIILDDPIKAADALSDTKRAAINEWFDNTIRSRLNSQEKGAIIIVMQRLHADDLVAHVQQNEEWDVLSFPAIAVDDVEYDIATPYGRRLIQRKEGDVLHPDLLSREQLEQQRRTMTEYHFAAQYQQEPTPREGNLVKREWFKFYDRGREPAKFSRMFVSWDTANKAEERNDYSVGTAWGVYGKEYYLLEVFRKRLPYPELKRAVIAFGAKYPRAETIIEDNASGTQLIQDLKFERMNLIRAYQPLSGMDKELRVDAQTVHFENGSVLLPREATWLRDYIIELTGFPNQKYDDQMDSTVQFLDYVNRLASRYTLDNL